MTDLQEYKEEHKEKIESEKTRTSNLIDDLGFLEVVSIIPTRPPIHPLKGIVIYILGTTHRLYVWDKRNNLWRFITLS